MTAKDFLKFWLDSADDAFTTAETLLKAKRYHHALFFCHLAIEKLLKGLVYKSTQSHAPPIHDLKKLASHTKLTFSTRQASELKEMTSWNINARYDSYKLEFYKRASVTFTSKWFAIAKEMYIWPENQY